jgi:hypothetical protein
VHRGRELLREALGTVESTLRAARPAAAFTAACVALWAARGTAAASTSTTSTSTTSTSVASTAAVSTTTGGLLISAAGWIFGLATAGALSVVVVGELTADSSAAPAKPSRAHEPTPVTSHVTTQAVTPSISATASISSPPRTDELVSLRAPEAPIRMVVSLLANEMNVPIRVEDGLEATVDCDATDVPALQLLDQLLAQANAQRTEVPALHIVQSGGSTDASALGGDLMSLQLRDVPMPEALSAIEAKLHLPIERDVTPMQLPGPTEIDGDLYIQTQNDDPHPELVPHVTIDVTNVTAGEALELVLEQTGLSYEHTTGFRIVAR